MKKLFLTLTVLIAFSGSIFAQNNIWEDINYHHFLNHDPLVAMLSLDNHLITPNDNYANYEVAAFVGDDLRGHGFMVYHGEFGDPNPILEFEIFYNPLDNENEQPQPVTFKMYDHNTGTLYTVWSCTMDVVTQTPMGNDYDFETMPVLSFYSPFTKPIDAYTERGGYYLIASPIGEVAPGEVGGMFDHEYDLYYFDQSKDLEWINYKDNNDGDFHLVPGKGYLYASLEATTLSFAGIPYSTDDYTVELDKVSGVDFSGWNLVGNPFPQRAYINKQYYTMNETGEDLILSDRNTVEAMEGVFVEAENDDATVTFSINPFNAKVKKQLMLSIRGNARGNTIDRTIVSFDDRESLSKLQLFEGNTKLYIPQDGKDNAMVKSEDHGMLPLNFKAGENGSYTLCFNTEGITMAYLHLIDKFNGNEVDLLETPSYSFESTTSDQESRFDLVFATGNPSDDHFAFYSNGNLVINNTGAATLQVVDITGRILSSESINGCYNTKVNAAAGVYMLHLINSNGVQTQKIIVK